jgi:phosphohistidine phosphatase
VVAELGKTGEAALEIDERPALYLATRSTLLQAINGVPDAVEQVMVVAHNPGLHDLARRLVDAGPAEARAALAEKYPTGALVVITFAGAGWADVAAGAGTLRQFIRPRDLT